MSYFLNLIILKFNFEICLDFNYLKFRFILKIEQNTLKIKYNVLILKTLKNKLKKILKNF
jgi:hypothetical protein